jgi:hypothetical protein
LAVGHSAVERRGIWPCPQYFSCSLARLGEEESRVAASEGTRCWAERSLHFCDDRYTHTRSTRLRRALPGFPFPGCLFHASPCASIRCFAGMLAVCERYACALCVCVRFPVGTVGTSVANRDSSSTAIPSTYSLPSSTSHNYRSNNNIDTHRRLHYAAPTPSTNSFHLWKARLFDDRLSSNEPAPTPSILTSCTCNPTFFWRFTSSKFATFQCTLHRCIRRTWHILIASLTLPTQLTFLSRRVYSCID